MPDDIHAAYIEELKSAGDWAALVRYGLAHWPHMPAIDAALDVLGGSHFGLDYAALRDWLREFRQLSFEPHEAPSVKSLGLNPAQASTVELVATFHIVAHCELAGQLPDSQQTEMYKLGLGMAQQWRQWSEMIGDEALRAAACGLVSRAQLELNHYEAAVASFEEALAAYRELASARPDVYLPDVAMMLNNLGIVQRILSQYDAAVAAYEEALAIRRQLALAHADVYLPDVAMSLNNLGNVQHDLSQYEAAAAAFQEALAAFRELASARPDVYLPYVATALNNLGNVQCGLSQYEAAVALSEEALAIRRQLALAHADVYLPDVAMTLHNLGNVQLNLSQYEAAVVAVEEALAIRRELASARPDVYLPDVAMTLNTLGNVQSNLSEYEAAVAAYEEALAAYHQLASGRPDVYRRNVAMTLNNLGIVQRDLSQYEAAVASSEEALAAYRELASARPDVYLPDVAMTLNALGIVQHDLNQYGAAVASYEEALAAYRELASARPDVYLPDMAMTLNNLGIVQHDLNQYGAAVASYEEALAAYRELASARPDVYLPDMAMTLNNLGTVQRDLSQYEAAAAASEEALAAYRELASARPNVYLPDLAVTLNNLGIVQHDLNQYGAAVASYEEARQVYEQHAEQFGSAHLIERVRLYHNYTQLVLRDDPALGWPDHALSRELLREGTNLAELFRGMFGDPQERIRVQEEQLSLYHQRVRVCLKCGELFNDPTAYNEALEAAEGSRSRSLLDALAQQVLPEEAPLELKEQFQHLQRNVRRAQRRLHQEYEVQQRLIQLENTDEPPESEGDLTERSEMMLHQPRYTRCTALLTSQVAALAEQQQRIATVQEYIDGRRPEYQAQVERLREYDPAFNPDRTIDSFRVQHRQQLFPSDQRTLFVHLQQGEVLVHGLVLSPEGLTPVALAQLTNDEVNRLASSVLASQLTPGLKSEQMQTLLRKTLPNVVQQLEPAVRESLIPALTDAGLQPRDRLVLVPDDVIGFLPLHAVQLTDDETLGDRYEVCYTRSLSILQQCLQREPGEPRKVFGAIDPTGTLAGVGLEAELAGEFFEEVTTTREVTHDVLLDGAREADVFYWMGHSQFSSDVPYWSGLILGRTGLRQMTDDQTGQPKSSPYTKCPVDLATFIDIDCGLTLEHCSLAIISGCQSGLALSGKGNEPVSLVSAFLHAGAKCVLASLWSVDDGACVLTMHRFLKAWRIEQLTIAAALKTAQQWLRGLTCGELREWITNCQELAELRFAEVKQALEEIAWDHAPEHQPYSSPYYWAPFVAVGHSWA